MVSVKVNTDVVNQTGEVLWLLRDQLGVDALDHIDATFIYRCTDFMNPGKVPAEGDPPPTFHGLGEFSGKFRLKDALFEVENNYFRSRGRRLHVMKSDSATGRDWPEFMSTPPKVDWFHLTFPDRRWTGSEVEALVRGYITGFAMHASQVPGDIHSHVRSLPDNVVHPPVFHLEGDEGTPSVVNMLLPTHGSDDLLPPAGLICGTYELAVDGAGWRNKMAGPQVGQTPPVAIRTWWMALLMVGGERFKDAQRIVGQTIGTRVDQAGFHEDRAEIIRRVPEATFLSRTRRKT